jgi:hypothetical protein
VRSPRFYTELFMTASSSPPPPPPDDNPPNGSGGGTPSTSPVSSEPSRVPRSAKQVHVDAPRAPRASKALNGPTVVVASAGVRAAIDGDDRPMSTAETPTATVAGSLRVEAPPAPERGLFETVVGSLLDFVF